MTQTTARRYPIPGRYDEWTLAELREQAEWCQVPNYPRMRKAELVQALTHSDSQGVNTPW